MATPSPIRLLFVNADPAMSAAMKAHLDRMEFEYRIFDAASREVFSGYMRSHRPQLVFAHEGGIPELSLEDVVKAVERKGREIPVVVLGESRRERPAIRVLRRATSEYVHLAEMERLPSIIKRLLRDTLGKGGSEELRNAAGIMQENQRLVTIGRLTGSIAHEINNPLEAVTNLLFLMEHEPDLPQKVRDYLTIAQKELERVVQISKQTLNFYRDTSSPVPIRMSSLLNEVLVLYARRISEKHLQVIRRFGEEQPLTIFPGEMRQVFSNLIANAIEACATHGKLHLRIRKSRFWGDAGIHGLRITIADNGTGMSAEVSRRIGEPFFTTKGEGGTGLGLWVSRSIIERYGGDLLLRSSTGKRHGTVFSILLPTNLRPRAVGNPPEAKPKSSGSTTKRFGDEPAERAPSWLANGA